MFAIRHAAGRLAPAAAVAAAGAAVYASRPALAQSKCETRPLAMSPTAKVRQHLCDLTTVAFSPCTSLTLVGADVRARARVCACACAACAQPNIARHDSLASEMVHDDGMDHGSTPQAPPSAPRPSSGKVRCFPIAPRALHSRLHILRNPSKWIVIFSLSTFSISFAL